VSRTSGSNSLGRIAGWGSRRWCPSPPRLVDPPPAEVDQGGHGRLVPADEPSPAQRPDPGGYHRGRGLAPDLAGRRAGDRPAAQGDLRPRHRRRRRLAGRRPAQSPRAAETLEGALSPPSPDDGPPGMPSTRCRWCPGGSVRGRGPARSRPPFVRAFTAVAPGFPAGALVRDGRRARPGAFGRAPRRLPSRPGARQEEARGTEFSRPLEGRDERPVTSHAQHGRRPSGHRVATGRARPLVRVRPEVMVSATDGPTGCFTARPEGLAGAPRTRPPRRDLMPEPPGTGHGPSGAGDDLGHRPSHLFQFLAVPTHPRGQPLQPSLVHGGLEGVRTRGTRLLAWSPHPAPGWRTEEDRRPMGALGSQMGTRRGKTHRPGGARKPRRPAARASRATDACLITTPSVRNSEEAG
jgi:hypothetical protein